MIYCRDWVFFNFLYIFLNPTTTATAYKQHNNSAVYLYTHIEIFIEEKVLYKIE